MAGAGKKTFTSGEVLTASDVNGYLMDQAVMKFADSAARGSAIAAPSEGMVTYLDDTDQLEVYNGSLWRTVSNAYAMAAARGTWDVGGSLPSIVDGASVGVLTITFPAGRFTQAPIVVGQSLTTYGEVAVASVSTASVSFHVINGGPGTATVGGGPIGTVIADMVAVQMTSGSALG
jgi:hypothetical protein